MAFMDELAGSKVEVLRSLHPVFEDAGTHFALAMRGNAFVAPKLGDVRYVDPHHPVGCPPPPLLPNYAFH